MAQSVKRPTLAQVIISQSVSSSAASASVLTAQSLEPAWDSVCVSLSAPPLLLLTRSCSLALSRSLSLSLSLSLTHTHTHTHTHKDSFIALQ